MRGVAIHNPLVFSTELLYTFIILILCLLIFFKTKEMYDLTKHKGIKYFRTAFLLLGIAYAARLMPAILHASIFSQQFFKPAFLWLLFALVTAYASTAGILFLAHSIGWKKSKTKYFPTLIHIFSVLMLLVLMATQSSALLVILQIIVLGYAVIISYNSKKKHKLSQLNIIYALLFLFWVFNIFMALNPRTMPAEIKIISYIISACIFGLITYKVYKVTKFKKN